MGASGKRRSQKHGWLELPAYDTDSNVRPAAYLPIYEDLLGFLRSRRFVLLELGVWKGHSLMMWRDAFPGATIVGVDLLPPSTDLGSRVHIVAGDHTDAALLARLRTKHAPNGFDVIIDDGSHLGVTTARSLQALYVDHLRPGGLYVIEDWGTGYTPSWSDGGALREAIDIGSLDTISSQQAIVGGSGVSMSSHDFGVVGLVKRLIDHTSAPTIAHVTPELLRSALPIEEMIVRNGIIILRKPSVDGS
jgi:SAM-dependent methyltransferase